VTARAPKQYPTRDLAVAAWLRRAKRAGRVQTLGGGWWRVQGWRKPVQGFAALAPRLAALRLVCQVPARDLAAPGGLWAWELAAEAPPPVPRRPPPADRCPTCDGTGIVTPDLDGRCDACAGSGWRQADDDGEPYAGEGDAGRGAVQTTGERPAWSPQAAPVALRCTGMTGTPCPYAVGMIDRRGYVYCGPCGLARRASGTPCRPLTGRELRTLQAGGTIPWGAQ